MIESTSRLVLLAILIVAPVSCSSAPPLPPATDEVPLPHLDDRWEPFNRSMWGFNDGVLRYFVAPLGTGYRILIPKFARTGLDNLFDNLGFPKRFFSSLTQGLWGGAGRETSRFLINTTVGIAGLFDVGDAVGIEPSDEDFGQAFAAAGWSDTRYLILPFGRPNTARDAVGGILDFIFDLVTYIPGGGILRGINAGSDEVLTYLPLADSTFDLYRLAQLKHHYDRETQIENRVHHADDCELCTGDPSVPVVAFTYRDPCFPCDMEERTVAATATGGELAYSAWIQPDPAPLVYILPGLGGHRTKRSTLAMAEVAYRAGFSAVTLSSAMNFEFITAAATTDVPGFAPYDALDVHRAIEDVHDDLAVAYPQRFTGRALLGMSLGGFHALFIADHDRLEDPSLRPFDAYLAINPPIRMEFGVRQLDAYYDVPLALPTEARPAFVDHAIQKALKLTDGTPEKPADVDLSVREAQFLIGLSFRQILGDVIVHTQALRSAGAAHTVEALALRDLTRAEADAFPYHAYFEEMVLPYYASREPDITLDAQGAARLFAGCDARALEASLAMNPRVRVMTNREDFLIDVDDMTWLESTLGPRVEIAERGGHLGDLHLPEVQSRMMDQLRSALETERRRVGEVDP